MKKYNILLALIALFFGSNSYAVSDDRVEIETISTNSSSGKCYAKITSDIVSKYTYDITLDSCLTIVTTGLTASVLYESGPTMGTTSTTVGDYVYFYYNGDSIAGWWLVTSSSDDSYTECTDDDYPYDGGDGYCYANEDFEDSFSIDDDAIAAFLSAAENAVGTYEFCVTSDDGYSIDCESTDDVQALLDLITDNIDIQEDEIDTQTDDYSSILTDQATLDAAIDEDSDSISLAAAETIVDNLGDETATLLSESTDLNSDSDDLLDDALVLETDADSSYADGEYSYETYTDFVSSLESATTQDEYDSVLSEMSDAGYCDGDCTSSDDVNTSVITSSFDDAEDSNDEIETISSTVSDNTTTIINNTTTTTDNSSTSSTVTSSVTTTTDSDDDTETDDSDSDGDSDFTNEASTTDYESFSEVMTNFYDSVDGSPLASAFSSFSDVITVPSGTCPTFSMDLSNTPIDASISTTLHCDLWDDVSDIISGVMMVVWCFCGFRIVAGA